MYGYTYGYPSGGGAGAVNGFESAVLSDGGTVVAIGNTTDLYSRLLGLGLINSASLVNSCNGGKADALYNFVPSPVQSLDRFVVTRASTKLRIGSNGLYGSVANNVPAFEFNTDGSYRGLLVEPGATNLALQSQAFNEAVWGASSGGTGSLPSVTANNVIAPDGTLTADTVVFNRGAGNTINDRSNFDQSVSIPSTGAYTFSVFAKATTVSDVGKQVFIRIGSAGSLIAVTLTASWVRYTRTEASVTMGLNPVQIGSRGTVTVDNSVSVDLWMGQAESGSVATSPIVTTAGTASRVADVVSLTGASSLIGQTEGTIFAELNLRTITGTARDVFYLKTADNANVVRLIVSSTNTIIGGTRRAGTSLNLTTSPLAYSGTTRIAFAYKDQDYALVINGTVVATSTNASSLPTATLDQMSLGTALINNNLTDYARQIVVLPTRIANATLQSLTTL
jgi:hypothetical protein